MKLNKAPIFVNGFKYGGTSLIMNMLASHPDVCMLSGETHEVFLGNKKRRYAQGIRRIFDFPVRLMTRPHIFSHTHTGERHKVPEPLKRYMDLVFYMDKLITHKNAFKSENVKYLLTEKMRSRFVVSNVNGNVLATEVLRDMYPDATFIAIVRNGLAVCEGHVRRRHSAKDFGRMYETVCQKMIRDSQIIPRYHIVYFEDMISAPIAFMEKIYSYADLDLNKVSKIRLRAKLAMNKDGIRRYAFGGAKGKEVEWFNIEGIKNCMRKDVNENQISRLSQDDQRLFLEQTQDSMRSLGYL